MTKKQTEYDIAKQAAKEAGCFLPEEHIFYSTIADTPAYIRFYCEKKGRISLLMRTLK